jgi:hypothetical protein
VAHPVALRLLAQLRGGDVQATPLPLLAAGVAGRHGAGAAGCVSDHRNDTLVVDLAGAPSITLEEARSMLRRRWQSDGELRLPERPDERGAILVRVPIFSVERLAYFEHGERARIFFLDRAEQPGAHAPRADHPRIERREQSVAPRQSQPGDAGPLFGTPGCAAPACEESTSSPAGLPASGTPLRLVCTKCEKPPAEGLVAIEGGTHWLTRRRNDASRPRVDFKRLQACGKWRRA